MLLWYYSDIICYLLNVQVYYESDIGVTEFGFVINTVIVIVVSFHLAVETLHWVCGYCYYCCVVYVDMCREQLHTYNNKYSGTSE